MNKINILLLLSAISIGSLQAILSPENTIIKISNNSSYDIKNLRIIALFNLADNQNIKKVISSQLSVNESKEIDLANEAGIEKSNITDLEIEKIRPGFASTFTGKSKASEFNIINNTVEEYKVIQAKENKSERKVGEKVLRLLKVEEVNN